MIKLVTAIGLTMLLAAAVAWMGPGRPTASVKPVPAPEAGGTCGCPGGYVCCLDCNGNTVCARSYAFCPECAAP
jgi:hypothetical protein